MSNKLSTLSVGDITYLRDLLILKTKSVNPDLYEEEFQVGVELLDQELEFRETEGETYETATQFRRIAGNVRWGDS